VSPLAAALTAFALFAAPVAAAALVRQRPRRAPLTERPPCVSTTVVVHEAGHTLLAWHCTAVADVLLVNVRANASGGPGGFVRNAWMTAGPQPATNWCRLVVALGGFAAEMMVMQRASSGPSREDLLEAAALCRAIVRAGGAEPPWPAPREREIAFERAFAEEMSGAELAVMRAGYATARDLLARRAESLTRLVVFLLRKPVARGDELAEVLGHRPVASTTLWRVLSNEVRAEFSV
jgi:ATP-dependent Zn protease